MLSQSQKQIQNVPAQKEWKFIFVKLEPHWICLIKPGSAMRLNLKRLANLI